jgi:hypothetical protein
MTRHSCQDASAVSRVSGIAASVVGPMQRLHHFVFHTRENFERALWMIGCPTKLTFVSAQ